MKANESRALLRFFNKLKKREMKKMNSINVLENIFLFFFYIIRIFVMNENYIVAIHSNVKVSNTKIDL